MNRKADPAGSAFFVCGGRGGRRPAGARPCLEDRLVGAGALGAAVLLHLALDPPRLCAGQVVGVEELAHAPALAVGQAAPAVRVDPGGDQAGGCRVLRLGAAVQGVAHEVDPHRQGRIGAVLGDGLVVVLADPDGDGQVGVVAGEPGVALVVGGAGLADDIIPTQLQGGAAGAALDHIAQHVGQDVGGDRVHDPGGHRVTTSVDLHLGLALAAVTADDGGRGLLDQGVVIAPGDPFDEPGSDLIAAV